MSTAIEAEPVQETSHDTVAVSRVRNNFIACRVKFKWFGTSKSLTSNQIIHRRCQGNSMSHGTSRQWTLQIICAV